MCSGYAFSEQVQDCLRNSLLQSLVLRPQNFISFDHFAAFVGSLHSSSLRKLKVYDWHFYEAAFPVQIFSKFLLMEFYMWGVSLHEAGWKSMRQEIPKCKTLESLGIMDIEWWGSNKTAAEVTVEFAQLLKDCPNILYANPTGFYNSEDDDIVDDEGYEDVQYTIHYAPILEHNRLIKNLTRLKKDENCQVRGFLVAEVIGRRFAQKPSSCYTVLKANVDVLVSYYHSSDENVQEVLRDAVDAPEIVIHDSTTANKQIKCTTPSKRKR